MEELRIYRTETLNAEASVCKLPIISALEEYEEKYFANQKSSVKFPFEIRILCEQDFTDSKCERKDLRNLECFTIDCDRTKDFDDGCSLSYENGIYHLGVHIADVAEYVKIGSALDTEAMKRGNSVYLPNMTIPMLPPILSENLCSLNEGCDRKALSVLFDIDSEGNVLTYSITKSLIRSRLKGIYSEVNSLLDGNASADLISKYAAVKDSLFHMNKLAGILRQKRTEAGADTSYSSNGPDIVFLDNGIDIIPRKPGASERIIEEFMVLTNRYIVRFMNENDIPAIYRMQKAQGKLAEYVPDASFHSSLNLEIYGHTTSPIRRLSDMRNHQMLSAFLLGCSSQALHYLFDEFIKNSCETATKRERGSDALQKKLHRMCYIEYYKYNPGRYTGTVIGFSVNGKTVVRLDSNDISVWCSTFASLGQRVSLNIDCTGVNCIDGQFEGNGLRVEPFSLMAEEPAVQKYADEQMQAAGRRSRKNLTYAHSSQNALSSDEIRESFSGSTADLPRLRFPVSDNPQRRTKTA